MSVEEKSRAEKAAEWWWTYLYPRETLPAARALSARLRQGKKAVTLCTPEVQELAATLHIKAEEADGLVRLVTVLAELRSTDPKTLPQRLAGNEPAYSTLRFERLMRAEGDELTTLLRRALIMVDRRCHVRRLAEDLLYWGEDIRTTWCFEYFSHEKGA